MQYTIKMPIFQKFFGKGRLLYFVWRSFLSSCMSKNEYLEDGRECSTEVLCYGKQRRSEYFVFIAIRNYLNGLYIKVR